jgi:hypothetical protein
VVGQSYLSASDVQDIRQGRADGLETRLGIDGRSIAFDRGGTVVGPIDVVVAWAAREPQGDSAGATDVIGIEGELQGRPGELTVTAGDLFMLDGNAAEITVSARVVKGVAVAGFRMSATGG